MWANNSILSVVLHTISQVRLYVFSICRIDWTSNALINPTGATIVEGDQSKFYSCGKIVLGSNRTQFMYHASR